MLFVVLGSLFSLAFLFLYRLQPPLYPYPLRWLMPALNLALAALLLLRAGPALLARYPALPRAAAPVVVALWLAAVLLAAQEHLTLSRPGVETDFSVFARRSERLAGAFQPGGVYDDASDGVLRADGFYNLGYPLLLWLLRPLTADNPFLAARLIAAGSGALLLLAGYWLARALLPPGAALLAMVVLGLSGLVVQYALYLGTDMPFAALVTLALALLLAEGRRGLTLPEPSSSAPSDVARIKVSRSRLALASAAGLAAGCAFLVRHLGLLLLLWGALHYVLAALMARARAGSGRRGRWFTTCGLLFAAYCLGFLIAASPQIAINLVQTGQPLYSQQAKNVWLAVYGNTDWSRWYDAPNDIGMAEVVLRDPARFLAGWRANLTAFFGSGAEDTSEFGRALQLRLLGWPANWLAAAGLLAWLYLLARRALGDRETGDRETGDRETGDGGLRTTHHALRTTHHASLLLFILLYAAAMSVAFALPRFTLPLAPIYATAAAWALSTAATIGGRRTADDRHPSPFIALSLVLLVLLWGGFRAGTSYVLGNQPPAEVAAARMVTAALAPGERLLVRAADRSPLAKYSAIAHRVAPWPDAAGISAAIDAARRQGVAYLLWDEGAGPPPLPAGSAPVARSEGYALYRLAPP